MLLGEILKGDETFGEDGNYHYLDCNDGEHFVMTSEYFDVNIYQMIHLKCMHFIVDYTSIKIIFKENSRVKINTSIKQMSQNRSTDIRKLNLLKGGLSNQQMVLGSLVTHLRKVELHYYFLPIQYTEINSR